LRYNCCLFNTHIYFSSDKLTLTVVVELDTEISQLPEAFRKMYPDSEFEIFSGFVLDYIVSAGVPPACFLVDPSWHEKVYVSDSHYWLTPYDETCYHHILDVVSRGLSSYKFGAGNSITVRPTHIEPAVYSDWTYTVYDTDTCSSVCSAKGTSCNADPMSKATAYSARDLTTRVANLFLDMCFAIGSPTEYGPGSKFYAQPSSCHAASPSAINLCDTAIGDYQYTRMCCCGNSCPLIVQCMSYNPSDDTCTTCNSGFERSSDSRACCLIFMMIIYICSLYFRSENPRLQRLLQIHLSQWGTCLPVLQCGV
jgi:hypothetical protein